MPLHLPRFGRKTRVMLVLLVAFAILAAAFDWNWFRRPAERYFINRSHRDVRIADLHVHINSNLEPTVRLRGVYIENAPWADSRPFASAGEISFTFSLKSISQWRPVVSKLLLVDADIDLERQADGHRNWRLRNPENVDRGRMKVMHLEARNSRIRFVRRDVNLEVVAAAAPLDKPEQNQAGTLTTQILFQGDFRGAEFSGEARTSDVITIMESADAFPLRGHIETGDTRLDVDGAVADLFKPSMMEGAIRMTGPSLARLHPFVPGKLPDSRPYAIEAQLRQKGEATIATGARIKIGGTTLTGDLSLDRSSERPMLKAALRSESADLADLGSLAGMKQPTKVATRRPETAKESPASEEAVPGTPRRIFSDKPLSLKGLNALDAEISLVLKKLKATAFPALESFKVTADLKNGVLSLAPVDLGIAEGHLAGSFAFDGHSEPPSAALKIDGRDIRMEKLLAGHLLKGTAAGPVFVHVDLKARGTSLSELASGASGRVSAGMENGVVTKLADAILELDLGKALRAVISGNQAIPVNKVDIVFDFKQGMGTSRNIFIDTERSRVVGTGTIDLRKEKVELVLTPHPKKPGIFALDKSIQVSGAIRKPHVAVVRRDKDPEDTSGVATAPAEPGTR